jgi:hypothetical protein
MMTAVKFAEQNLEIVTIARCWSGRATVFDARESSKGKPLKTFGCGPKDKWPAT